MWIYVTIPELKAFHGILIIAGVSQHYVSCGLKKTGWPIFAVTMPINRFKDFINFLQFDNKITRRARKTRDKMPAFHDVWEMFAANLCKNATCLGRTWQLTCSWILRQMSILPVHQSNPVKYSIKIWWNCDAETSWKVMSTLVNSLINHITWSLGQRLWNKSQGFG